MSLKIARSRPTAIIAGMVPFEVSGGHFCLIYLHVSVRAPDENLPMKIGKITSLILPGVLAVVLVYPGLPAGTNLSTRPSERYAMLTCYYLHWDGIHHKEIDVSCIRRLPHHRIERPLFPKLVLKVIRGRLSWSRRSARAVGRSVRHQSF